LFLALVVGAGDHLTEQPHGDELHADHHQQHGQQQQGPVADALAEKELEE
jgi:hypothetical protein